MKTIFNKVLARLCKTKKKQNSKNRWDGLSPLDEWFSMLDEYALRDLFPVISKKHPESKQFLTACDEYFQTLTPEEKSKILNSPYPD